MECRAIFLASRFGEFPFLLDPPLFRPRVRRQRARTVINHHTILLSLYDDLDKWANDRRQIANFAVGNREDAVLVHGELVEALRLRDKTRARDCSHKMLDLAVRDLAAAERVIGRTK
ncbi:MAG: GntR family transcriptional regulator protein [Rhizobium sp.]|nr:GntR family transcriptional regulator protein [Rhizobium sp.]